MVKLLKKITGAHFFLYILINFCIFFTFIFLLDNIFITYLVAGYIDLAIPNIVGLVLFSLLYSLIASISISLQNDGFSTC